MQNQLHDSHLSDTLAEAGIETTLTFLRRFAEPMMTTSVGPVPTVYGIWIDKPLYLDARWPYYIGSADDGRRRLLEHRTTYSDAAGLRPESVRLGWLYTENSGIALWAVSAEHLLIANIQPVANRVLSGAGCKGRGALRSSGKPSPFWIVHPRAGEAPDLEARG